MFLLWKTEQTHTKLECPVRKALCNRYKKIGHYAKMCKSKLHVNEVERTKSANNRQRFSKNRRIVITRSQIYQKTKFSISLCIQSDH